MNRPVIQPPPLNTRISWVVLWLALGLGVVLAFEGWVVPWLTQYLQAGQDGEIADRIRRVFVGLALGEFVLAGWLLWFAWRILRAGQYPLPGAFVLRPTPVEYGRSARLRATGLAVIGLFLLGMGAWTLLIPYRFLGS